MPIAALDLLVLLTMLVFVIFAFTRLKKSKTVGRFAHDVVDTPPDSDDELIAALDGAADATNARADELVAESIEARRKAEKLNRYKKLYGG